MGFFIIDLLLVATISGAMADTCLGDNKQVDMAFSAVDDQYRSCTDRIMGDVTGSDGLLRAELKADGSFQDSWTQAEGCNKTVPGLNEYHSKALALYTSWNRTFPNTFDTDTQALGPDPSVYRRYFPYKSLHFLLTDAVRVLREQQGPVCRTVSGRRGGWELQPRRGDRVRIGRFFLGYPRYSSRTFDLTVRTCHGVELTPCSSRRGRVLVPPYESFKVVAVRGVGRERRFYLESIGTYSNLQCALYSGSSEPSQGSARV
ncbi:GPI-linked NAD(P)(+)--arginine ADP-ribosyltransferase 1-like [Megalops cyprinoides]|uniref:GPI-linked NAD(P)(+)--arginine ADP-ribosyltransferase 1-like n=1 Tax=Megalops cyprinoides TaxID=118141 RepID=UPI00186566C1|nr:GPI-linked NAD(P)(+)--arginine ADP-ribosyltransferase 1-like [Megalops cyprinoides]